VGVRHYRTTRGALIVFLKLRGDCYCRLRQLSQIGLTPSGNNA
jgi:hypothetical protein